eukprot:TRINITY_DN12016_c0_g1_i2.p1 TRINITY_DN12016_c0_g1~~TRINITY_DN12016_c0_g1_i2.p1  ORF type:complete len:116 (-),score=38.70 TRINITY_DN12016_c0_g1_i2:234-581(-)
MCIRDRAHTLLEYALQTAGPEVQDKLQEVLFRHYFTDGCYPDSANLGDAAQEAGLDRAKALEFIHKPEEQERVAQEASRFSRSGINGVPYFLVNDKPQFSGAQPPSAFKEAFARA